MDLIAVLLIFTRIIGAIFFLPIMTQASSVPAITKAGLSFMLAIVVSSTMSIQPVGAQMDTLEVLTFTILLVKELLVGITLSYCINVFFNVYNFVGQLWGMQGGLSQAMMFDPSSGIQVAAIGKLYAMAFGIVFMCSGGYHWFISSLVESFKYIPLGNPVFKGELLWEMVSVVVSFWEVSFKIAAPIVGVIFIVDCALGILARTVPQMNMFAIGIPLKTSILFICMLLMLGLFEPSNNLIIKHMVDYFFDIAKGMIPA